MNDRSRVPVHRSERKPLYVQVLTEPVMRGCWSVNLSETGIGLIASPASPDEGPKEGEEIELSFALPGARARIRVRGVVRWRHDAVQPTHTGATTAMGVQFSRFEGSDQVKVARYLLGSRLKVVVAHATRDAEGALRAALREDVELLFVASDEEVEDVLGRGDVSALVVHGTSEPRATRVVEQIAALLENGQLLRDQPREIIPPILYWGTARPQRLIELFNADRLYRALEPDCPRPVLREAVLEACRQHGMRIEHQRMALELERHLLRERARSGGQRTHEVDGSPGFTSAAMGRVMELVRVVAPHRVAVLLQGETGTGKEVLARTLHRLSHRNAATFVVQDCGALPETLLESELFGHVKGAFTGAVADHPGLFVLADGGTIFLDEIENTTGNLQAKLLRVIETGEVRPVGGSSVRQVDVRIIAASNRNLEEEVRQGRFRSDLFFRLNTFVIDVPPLRERPDDILPLARHFIEMFNRTLARSARGLTPEAEELLLRHDWTGNIRELRNVMERAVLLTEPGQPITLAQFPDALIARSAAAGDSRGPRRSFAERLAQAERQILREAMDRCGGVLRRAAKELEMDPVTLGRRARKLGLWPARGRDG